MKNHLMGKRYPPAPGDGLHQIELDALGSVRIRQIQSPGKPENVGVYNNSFGLAERDTENDIRCLARDAGELQKVFHGIRDFPPEFVDYHSAGALNAFGLVAKEPGRPDIVLQHLGRDFHVVLGCAVLFEQIPRYNVHPLISALSRQYGRDQELQRVAVQKGALGIRVRPIKAVQDPFDANRLFARAEFFLFRHGGPIISHMPRFDLGT